MKKTIAILMSVCLLTSSVLVGCTDEGASSSVDSGQSGGVPIEPVGFEETNVKLVENGISDYKIVISANATPEQQYSAEELQYFLEQSTGCKLQIIPDTGLTASEDTTYLSVGPTTLLEAQTDIVLDKEFYGATGVSIDTVGKSVYMTGVEELGTLYSVYRFLYYQIGFKAYATDCVKFDYYKTLPLLDFDYHYAPSIEYFTTSERELRGDTKKNLRMYTLGLYGSYGSGGLYQRLFDEWSHTCSILVNPEYYKADHPEWFLGDQFCFSNDEFADQMAKNIIQRYTNSSSPYIMIGGADTVGSCPCEECKKQGFIYGGHPGLLVRFMNKVAAQIEEYYEANNIDKEYMLVGLMYHAYMTAPVIKDESGNLIPIHEDVIPDSEGQVQVGVCYTPISSCTTHAYIDPTCETNIAFGENLQNWDYLTDNLFCYTYGANFTNPTFFFDNWAAYETQVDSLVEAGVKYWTEEARETQESIFGELRTFIKSSLAWNHTLKMEDLIDEFMEAYYGVAAEDMKAYFNLLLDKSQVINKMQGFDCQGCYHDIKKTEYWPHEELLNHSRLLMNAIYKIRQSDYTDADKASYEEHIYHEYLLVKTNEYLLYRTDLSAEELAELEKLVAYADSIMADKGKENLQ